MEVEWLEKLLPSQLNGQIGRHCVAELGGGCPHLLNDESYISQVLKEAAEICGAQFLGLKSHKFEPQGVTAIALLSESHISVHSWPELGYLAADCFTCGDHCDPEAAIRHIKQCLLLTEGSVKIFDRRMPVFSAA